MKQQGFTLLEVSISIAVSVFLLFAAYTSWFDFKRKNEMQLIIADIKTAVHYAKIQAINHNQKLQLSSNNWSNGMQLIRAHSDKNALIHEWHWVNANWDIRWIGVNGKNNIIINGTYSNAMSNGRFVATNKHNGQKIVLILNKIGRVKQI